MPQPAPSVWVCTGPLDYDRTAVDRDIANLKAALEGLDGPRGSCPSWRRRARTGWRTSTTGPRRSSSTRSPTPCAVEYQAIVDAGFMLQVDDAVLMHEMDSILAEGGSIEDYRRGRSCAWTR